MNNTRHNTMNKIAKTLLVGIVILVLQGCSWLRQELVDPDIQVIGFKHLKGNNLLEQRFILRLQLTNPNDLELDVKAISFLFNIADIELIQGVSNDVPVIKPYSKTEFTVQGSANVIQAARLLKKMQKNPDKRFDYTLHTKVDLAHGWPSTFNLKRDGDVGLNDWLQKR
jgi:LEA14-like dessication related protein